MHWMLMVTLLATNAFHVRLTKIKNAYIHNIYVCNANIYYVHMCIPFTVNIL